MSEACEDRDGRAGGATMLQPVILRWGEEGGRVLWDATSRGLCGRVGPPRTNVRVAWANCERGQSR